MAPYLVYVCDFLCHGVSRGAFFFGGGGTFIDVPLHRFSGCVGSIAFVTIMLPIDLRFPDIQAKVVPLMKDYLLALRSKDDTPSPLLMTSRTSEEDVLDSFKAEIVAKQAGN